MRHHTDTTLRVRHLMTPRVLTVEPETTLQQAIRAMVREGFRHLPIVRAVKVVALVSDRNIRIMVNDLVEPEDRRHYLTHTTVMAHATQPVVTIGPDATAPDAAHLFVENHIGCLPVVDRHGKLIGILTQTDILTWLTHVSDCPVCHVPRAALPLGGAA